MRTITVTGTGAAAAVPDSAVVRLAAVHRAGTLADALGGAESARSAVVDNAGALVVSATDLSVWPAHDQQGAPAGFEARHALSVRCGDLEEAGALLTRLAAEVGDRLQVEGVSLEVAGPAPYVVRAREAAMADARVRAEHLAGLAGATLRRVEQVVEGGASAPGPVFAMAKADVSLVPGTTTIGATLTVTWSFDD